MPGFQFLGGDYGRGRLESALAEPQQTFDGRFLYRTVFDKAAALFRSLIEDHPLLDGNKRLALTSVAVFLALNGYIFYIPRDKAVAFTLQVAAGEKDIHWKEISRWLRRSSISVESLRKSEAGAMKRLNVPPEAVRYLRELVRIITRERNVLVHKPREGRIGT